MFTADIMTGMICVMNVVLSMYSIVKFIRYIFDRSSCSSDEAWSYCLIIALMCGIFLTIYSLEKCRLEEAAEERLKEKRRQQRKHQMAKKQRQQKSTQVQKKPVSAKIPKTYMENHKPKQKIS